MGGTDEVHPGADPVNRRPGETKSLQPGTEVRTLRGKREKAKVPFKKSGTADSFVSSQERKGSFFYGIGNSDRIPYSIKASRACKDAHSAQW